MSVNLDRSLAVHEQAIRQRGERTKLLATNIANVDTPNYKARDLVFGDTLTEATSRRLGTARAGDGGAAVATDGHLRLAATDGRHLGAGGVGASRRGDSMHGTRVMYRNPEAASLDGNTVDKDLEQARFAENAIRYQASVQFLQSRVSSLIKSLRSE